MHETIQALHHEAKDKAAHYRRAEGEMIEIMIRLDEHKVFMHLGYASLYEYCLKELHLSEANTCNFIAVARKSREVPQLKSEIAAGNLSVSKARKIAPVLNKDNAALWLAKAQSLTHKALEKEVAREKPETLVPIGARYISEDKLALQVSITEALMDDLARVKDLLSQKQRESITLENALAALVAEFLERHDPIRKAQRAQRAMKRPAANLPAARQVNWQEAHTREAIKNWTKHEVMFRDQGRCTYVHANGQRCKERRFLEMHHLKPVSLGGENSAENLTLLCSTHHKHWHLRMHRSESQQEILKLG